MYFCSGLQGQGTSFCPGASGMPTECMQGTKTPSPSDVRAPRCPMRAMMRMLTTT